MTKKLARDLIEKIEPINSDIGSEEMIATLKEIEMLRVQNKKLKTKIMEKTCEIPSDINSKSLNLLKLKYKKNEDTDLTKLSNLMFSKKITLNSDIINRKKLPVDINELYIKKIDNNKAVDNSYSVWVIDDTKLDNKIETDVLNKILKEKVVCFKKNEVEYRLIVRNGNYFSEKIPIIGDSIFRNIKGTKTEYKITIIEEDKYHLTSNRKEDELRVENSVLEDREFVTSEERILIGVNELEAIPDTSDIILEIGDRDLEHIIKNVNKKEKKYITEIKDEEDEEIEETIFDKNNGYKYYILENGYIFEIIKVEDTDLKIFNDEFIVGFNKKLIGSKENNKIIKIGDADIELLSYQYDLKENKTKIIKLPLGGWFDSKKAINYKLNGYNREDKKYILVEENNKDKEIEINDNDIKNGGFIIEKEGNFYQLTGMNNMKSLIKKDTTIYQIDTNEKQNMFELSMFDSVNNKIKIKYLKKITEIKDDDFKKNNYRFIISEDEEYELVGFNKLE